MKDRLNKLLYEMNAAAERGTKGQSSESRLAMSRQCVHTMARLVKGELDQRQPTSLEQMTLRMVGGSRGRISSRLDLNRISDPMVALDAMRLLALVWLTGWATRLIGRHRSETHLPRAVSYFMSIFKQSVDQESLLLLWELAHRTDGSPLSNMRAVLAVERWIHDEHRSDLYGATVAYTVSTEWEGDGLLLALLAARHSRATPSAELAVSDLGWTAEAVRSRLASMRELGLLAAMDEQEWVRSSSSVVALVDRVLLAIRKREIVALVEAPVSSSRVRALEEAVGTALTRSELDRASFSATIRRIGLGSPDAARMQPLPTPRKWALHKYDVCDGYVVPVGLEAIIGEDALGWEGVTVCGFLENALPSVDSNERSGTGLGYRVAALLEEMRSEGSEPDVVIVPRDMGEVLFGEDTWMAPGSGQLGELHVGDWLGCHVLQAPHSNCASVIIATSKEVFASSGSSLPAVSIEVYEDKAAEAELLRRALAASESGEVPKSDQVRVNATVRVRPSLALADLSKARRVSLVGPPRTSIEGA